MVYLEGKKYVSNYRFGNKGKKSMMNDKYMVDDTLRKK